MYTFLLAALLSVRPASASVFVQADVVNLRTAPETGAARAARLRINTELDVLDERDDWLYVRMTRRPEDHPVEGWVLGRFVTPQPRSAPEAHQRALDAVGDGRTDRAIRWAERATAIDGTRTEDWELLASLYTSVSDTAGEARARGVLEGSHDVYLASCMHGRASLEAVYRPGDGFTALGQGAYPDQDLAPLAADLAAMAWYEHGADGAQAVSGTPFVQPFLTAFWNEPGTPAYAPESCGGDEGMCGMEREIIRLGPCDTEGALFATAPLAPIAPTEIGLPEARVPDEVGETQAYAIRFAGELHALQATPVQFHSSARWGHRWTLSGPDGTVAWVDGLTGGAGC